MIDKKDNNLLPQPEYKALRRNSLNFDTNGYYICTGVPGTGFYVRQGLPSTCSLPVPLDYAKDNVEKRSYSQVISVKTDPKTSLMTGVDSQSVSKKQENGCLRIALGIALSVGGVLAFMLDAGPLGALLLLVGIVFLCKSLDKKRVASSSFTSTYNTQQRTVNITTNVLKVPQNVNPDDYYIQTAEQVLSNEENDIARRILQNYISIMRNPDAENTFDADSLMSGKSASAAYKDFCESFETVMRSEVLLYQDYVIEAEPGSDSLDTVSTSPVSLYVGVFDFIGSSFDIPVLDIEDFKIYLYPTFAIKAYDPFTFQVLDYGDVGLSVTKFWYGHKSAKRLSDSGYKGLSKHNEPVYEFGRLTLRVQGAEYNIIVSNAQALMRLRDRWNKFFSLITNNLKKCPAKNEAKPSL